MKIRKLNKTAMVHEDINYADLVCFIQLPYSKLFRVITLPRKHYGNQELRQVLNTLCLRYRNGVYFFRITAPEAMEDIGMTLLHMDVDCIFLQPEMMEANIPQNLN